jgi:hypothetical protein
MAAKSEFGRGSSLTNSRRAEAAFWIQQLLLQWRSCYVKQSLLELALKEDAARLRAIHFGRKV